MRSALPFLHALAIYKLIPVLCSWCGPCKLISPILERLTSDPKVTSGGGQALDLVTVDVEAQTELAEQYQVCPHVVLYLNCLTDILRLQISSLPTVIAFVDGEPVSQFMGVIPEKGIRRFLATL